jgi:integrase
MNELLAVSADLAPSEANPADLPDAYLAGLGSAVSRAGMASALRSATRILTRDRTDDWRDGVPWHLLTAAHVAAVLAEAEGAPATRNKILAALKGVARAGFRMGVISADAWARIQDVPGAKGKRLLRGKDIPSGELGLVLQACAADPSPAGRRDAAMVALAAGTGMRREELVKLRLEDLRGPDEDGHFAGTVVGKGDKERTLHVVNGAAAALGDWLAVRGTEPGPVFCPIRKGGKIEAGKGMTTTGAHGVLVRRAGEAGVAVAWHDLRRTVTGNLLDAGHDIATVAGLLGHSSVTTTQRYDRRGERVRKAAALSVSVPYRRRHS